MSPVNADPDLSQVRPSRSYRTVSTATLNGPQVTGNLTSVENGQRIVLTLFGVSDGINTNKVSIPMGVLLGDVNGNGRARRLQQD